MTLVRRRHGPSPDHRAGRRVEHGQARSAVRRCGEPTVSFNPGDHFHDVLLGISSCTDARLLTQPEWKAQLEADATFRRNEILERIVAT